VVWLAVSAALIWTVADPPPALVLTAVALFAYMAVLSIVVTVQNRNKSALQE